MALLLAGARPHDAPALKHYFLRMRKLYLLLPELRRMRAVAFRIVLQKLANL